MRGGAERDLGGRGRAQEPGVAAGGRGAVAVVDVLGVAADSDPGQFVAVCWGGRWRRGGRVDGEAGALVAGQCEEGNEDFVRVRRVERVEGAGSSVEGWGAVEGAEEQAAVEAGACAGEGGDEVAFL